MARNTATRDRHRAAIARGKPDCALCHQPIDYSLKYPELGAYVVDHITPLGPSPSPERMAELDVIGNKQPAHNKCNRAKWDRVGSATVARVFVTDRRW